MTATMLVFPAILLVIGGPAARCAGAAQRVLLVETRDNSFYTSAADGFRSGLKKRGYDTDRVKVDVVALSGKPDQDRKTIGDKLAGDYRLIVPLGTDALMEVADEDTKAPVLFSMILDPVSLGLVRSFDAPGGGYTGTTILVSPGKQIDALLQTAPNARRIGVLYTDGDKASLNFLSVAAADAKRLGAQIVPAPVGNARGAGKMALEGLAGKVDALWMIPDPASAGQQAALDTLDFARRNKLPVLGTSSGAVRAGALLALSADVHDLGDVTAEMATQLIDGGASPAGMRVRGPRQTLLSVNLDAARALGIAIPDSVLHLANEVIDSKED